MERMLRHAAAHQSLLLLPLLAVIAALALLLAALVPLRVLAVDAPSANGTVKIHDDEPEPDPEIRNQPHVCGFHVHGFNFDDGQNPQSSGARALGDDERWST